MTAPTTGRFAWHELHTSDRARALRFYARLVGWETKEFPTAAGEPYGMCFLGGKDLAGVTGRGALEALPYWLPYIATPGVDAAANRVVDLGGKVLAPPADIPGAGRFAVVSDPQGATFALYSHHQPHEDEPSVPPVGAFCWDELMTTDPQASAAFYAALFGYDVEITESAMGPYRILKRGDHPTGGIMSMPRGVPQPNWIAYLYVSDVDASTRLVKELGGQVFVSPTDIPKVGRFSVIADPTGAGVALFTGTSF